MCPSLSNPGVPAARPLLRFLVQVRPPEPGTAGARQRGLRPQANQGHPRPAREQILRVDLPGDLPGHGQAEDIPITSLGRWWSKNEEIDLVALDEENKTIWFGECKWSNRKVGTEVYQDLRRKSELVEWHAGRRNERFVLFSRSGFTPAMLDLAKREKVVLAEGESTHR